MYVIGNGKLISVSGKLPYHESGAVAVEGSIITEVGETEHILEKYPDADYIDAKGCAIAPGFIDLHTHSNNLLLGFFDTPRFKASDRYKMFSTFLWPIENKIDFALSEALAYASAVKAIKSGTTTMFVHHSLPMQPSGSLHSLASVFRESGLRVCLSIGVSDRYGARRSVSAIKENDEFIEFCSSLNIDTLRAMFGLHSLLELSDETLKACVKANTRKAAVHVPVGRTPDDYLFSVRKYGMSPARRLYEVGALTPNSIVCCGPFIEEEDLELLAESGCCLTVSPAAASMLGSAYSSLFERIAKNCKLHLGSENLCADMLEAARLSVYQFSLDGETCDDVALAAEDMLFRANPSAASAVFGRRLGVLEVGAAADIIVLRPALQLNFDNEHQIIRSVLFSGAECVMTMVNGRILMRDGELCDLDERAIGAELSKRAASLVRENYPIGC